MLISNALLLLTAASSALAIPAAVDNGAQVRFGSNAGKAALNWGAGAVSKIGGGVETSTVWNWVNCGEDGDAVTINSVKVSPDPPQPGQDLTIYAEGTVNNDIKDGSYADVVVKLGLIKLLTKRFDICEELSNANATLQCPIEADEYAIEQTVALPEEIPRAKFVVDVHAFTQTEQPLACLSLMINFLLPDPPAN